LCRIRIGNLHAGGKKVKIRHVKKKPHILLINPWITDFSAYNFWIRPLGLLSIASLVRDHGCGVSLIDCLGSCVKAKKYADGKFLRTKIKKPEVLGFCPRYYNRYGIPEEAFLGALSSMERPDMIAVTSGMTYWYPGVFRTIELARKELKGVPVVLGGIYATLCHEHAQRFSGADLVFKGGGAQKILYTFERLLGYDFSKIRNPHSPFHDHPYPAFDLYPQPGYVCIATSRGCPLRCTYCASRILNEAFSRRDPEDVVREIEYWTVHYGIDNIAFYDDAFLIDPKSHAIPILNELIAKGIRLHFHAPNGLHIREIDDELAALLFRAGFRTIRLGFETSRASSQIGTGGKVDNRQFGAAVRSLKRAGFSEDEIGAYIMAGLPGQPWEEVEESIAFVRQAGARPMLVEYSPIPGTPLFEKAKGQSPFDFEKEPLFQNNSILPCRWEGFTVADFRRLKDAVRNR
jgi:hypothetical protein